MGTQTIRESKESLHNQQNILRMKVTKTIKPRVLHDFFDLVAREKIPFLRLSSYLGGMSCIDNAGKDRLNYSQLTNQFNSIGLNTYAWLVKHLFEFFETPENDWINRPYTLSIEKDGFVYNVEVTNCGDTLQHLMVAAIEYVKFKSA